MSLKRNPSRNVVNFAAGPSAMPYEVLEIAQRELVNFNNTGTSVMEISHRSATFSKIITQAEANVRDLLKVPDNYKVMFLQGGGNGQFSAVAMNLMNRKPNRCADYVVSGYWSEKAAEEAKKYGQVNFVIDKLAKYNTIPPVSKWKLNPDASYVYICENETIDGVEYSNEILDQIKETIGDVPLVADCCSNLFSRQIDVTKYGLIFAGAQKNFGPAGVTVVIIRDDLLNHQMKECPIMLDYKIQAGNGSLYQTPPCFSIYMCGLVFEWLKRHGGMEGVGRVNALKSALVYETIDQSNGFYFSPVDKKFRSRVTLPFRIRQSGGNKESDEALEKRFIEEAEKQKNFKELKGHRSVGGIRAAIFNALSYEEIEELVSFMKDFMNANNSS